MTGGAHRPRTPQGSPHRPLGVTLLGLVAACAFLATQFGAVARSSAAGAAPQQADDPSLTVLSVSPWVEPEGTFRVSFDASGLPAEATVSATIHQRLNPGTDTLRTVTEEELGGDASTRNLQAPVAVALSELSRDGDAAVFDIPIRSGTGDPRRQLIPTAGIHPVTLEATDAEGGPLGDVTVYLNRLPVDPVLGRDGDPAIATVQLLAALDSGPSLGADGAFDLPSGELVAVQAWRSMLGSNLEVPLTVALRPNTLVGLQRSGDPLDTAFLSDLADSEFVLAPQTYVRVDVAGIAESDTAALERQLARGEAILTQVTGSAPEGPWMLDDTIDTSTAGLLAMQGTEQFLVSPDRLELEGTERGEQRRRTLLSSRALALEDVPGGVVSSYDVELTALLLEPGFSPALRAHHVATALMSSWFDAAREGSTAFPGVSSAILLYPGTDHEVLESLVDSLGEAGPVQLGTPDSPTADADGAPVRARLVERPAEMPGGVLTRWRRTDERIGGFDSMTSPGDASTTEWALLNDQTPSSAATSETRVAVWNSIDSALEERLAQIQTPPPRTVVLTSRSESIPIRIRNRGTEPLTVRMSIRSPRLDFPEGPETEVLLQPGENRVDVPVTVRAPGSSILRVELTSPNEVLDIREVRVTVRSWSISGVGAVLSVISLAVLAIWWLRTSLRRRREDDSTDAGTHPDNSDGQDRPGEQDTTFGSGTTAGDDGT